MRLLVLAGVVVAGAACSGADTAGAGDPIPPATGMIGSEALPVTDPTGDTDNESETEPVAPDEPRLPTAPPSAFAANTCFQPSAGGGDPAPVGCDEPHRLQVFASEPFAGEPVASGDAESVELPSADDASEFCGQAFLAVTGVGPGLALAMQAGAVRPTPAGWENGERNIACYVVHAEPVTGALGALDPLRSAGRVSLYGLQDGDCLVDLDLTATDFAWTTCDQPHDGEVFASYDLPIGEFPGADLIDSLADSLCFGQGFTDFIGLPYAESVIDAMKSTPTADTWPLGHRRISCIATDGLIHTASLAASGR